MRAAELYLIEAEANARMGGHETEALAALNALRQNRETVTANHQVSLCTVLDIPADDVRWEWLLPKQEMDSNKQMVQNDL